MNLNKRYCCNYLPYDSEGTYFEIIIYNKDMNEIINKINEELSINFKVDNSYLDDNLGLLLQDESGIVNNNIPMVKGNLLFICHYANLEKYVKVNSYLNDKTNNEVIFHLCKNFILFKNVK